MRQLRETRNLNQGEVARLMPWAQSEVSRIESAQKEPTADFVVAFAEAMEIPVTEALLAAGLITDEAYQRVENSKGVLDDAKDALELVRLLGSIEDDDEREAAIQDIRALLRVRAERVRARQTRPPGGATGTGGAGGRRRRSVG